MDKIKFDKILIYKKYLNTIQKHLDNCFEDQKEYICCSKGCALCCKKGVYPCSEIEFQYLVLGLINLEPAIIETIMQKISELKEAAKNNSEGKFIHQCPFLNQQDECYLYEYRPIICRTFGLLHRVGENSVTIPFCSEEGLNYSKVYDGKQEKIIEENIYKYGYKKAPHVYNISLKEIVDDKIFTEGEHLFGETKALLDWFED